MENPKDLTNATIATSEFNKVTGYKVNVYIYQSLPHTSKKRLEIEVKQIKTTQLGINLTKYILDPN